ncbi:hypothetical protein H5S40_08480 [Limosilactobacillus sp. RRLNB_1_1]|uniref:Polysaccharide polymerase n=1 Tax=Limosilactobacillus albertensis TaxID=2759752 RepID=A0A7W3TT85_9LACO|nr:hypothetical protein [Limosilactobacillus albertensis]MBB1070186.1 hypothetical protein [Limosilactobacillus albertensis]MCD7119218.1 hypothetical protein [Limosilactobacillus albertensis]MCD7129426.1 hypothetical protein [Limosilactobacillus albertensis]
MSVNEKNGWYTGLLTLILGIEILMQYSIVFANISNQYGGTINSIVCTILVVAYCINIIQNGKLKLDNIILIILFLVILLIIQKNQILELFIFCIAFLNVTPITTIYIYRNGIFISYIINMVLAIVTHHLYNTEGDTIALGFGNQNTAAFFLAFLVILFLIKKDMTGNLFLKVNWRTSILLIFTLIIVYFLFGDMTATILIVSFFIFQYIIPWLTVRVHKVILLFLIVFPVFLTYSTYWLAMNYGNSLWIMKLNTLLSGRLNIWNYYFIRMPIKLISNNRIFVVSAWGNDYTPHQGLFDGSYAYMLYIIGLLFTIIYVLGLVICNYRLLKYKKYLLLSLILSLELVGFSENQMFSYAYSFTSIFALLSFHRSWIRKRS